MDDMLWRNPEFMDFRREMERRIRELDAEINRMKWQRTVDATDRSNKFWLGLAFFTWLLLLVSFTQDWA